MDKNIPLKDSEDKKINEQKDRKFDSKPTEQDRELSDSHKKDPETYQSDQKNKKI